MNDSKYYVISDISKEYDEINKKIVTFTKLYFYTMKNHSYQLAQIENNLNQYNIKGEVKIKQLLENQQNIIKELIKIINNILQENRNNRIINKNEEKIKINYFPLKQKNIIMNNNLHIFAPFNYPITKSIYQKNNFKEKILNTNNDNFKHINAKEVLRSKAIKSVDDRMNSKKIINQKKIISLNVLAPKNINKYKEALSFVNKKSSKQNIKKNVFKKFVNKDEKSEQNIMKHKLFKSMSTSEIFNKSKIMNKNNLYLKTNNISNNNPYINNNYTIDEEKNGNIDCISLINERQNSISSSNMNENYGNLPHILTKRKKRIKYRVSRRGKILLTDKDNYPKNMVRVKSAKDIPIKTEFYQSYNSYFPNFTLTNSFADKNTDFSYHKRCNSALSFLTGNLNNLIRENNRAVRKIENEIYNMPYINNGKRIIPTRFTKEVLNSSYKILNKYKHKQI